MSRKIFSVLLAGVLTLSLAGCGNKMRIEPEGVSDTMRTQLDDQAKEGQALLAAAQDDNAKIAALLKIAFSNDQLGRFDLAVEAYKKILEIDPKNFPALNNLGVIYERLKDFATAAQYYSQLLEANPSNIGALGDTLRALVAAGDFDAAQSRLDNFSSQNADNADDSMTQFIANQNAIITQARAKAQGTN